MRHQRNWIGLQLQCTCTSKRFVFEVFYCYLYLRDFSLVLASSIANLNGTINNPSFLEKLIVLFACKQWLHSGLPCSLMRRDRLSGWLKLQQKMCHAFFFPLLAKELAQSQPVTVWNPRRVLHILSPKAWVSCTGIKQNLSFTLVWNHSSGQSKLLKNQWWK